MTNLTNDQMREAWLETCKIDLPITSFKSVDFFKYKNAYHMLGINPLRKEVRNFLEEMDERYLDDNE